MKSFLSQVLPPLNPSRSGSAPLKRRSIIRFRFFLVLSCLWVSGCGTLPSHYVRVEPVPIRSFPPIQPGFVDLPVVINFPTGRDLVQDVANLFKGGIKQLAQNMILKSKLKLLWDKMAAPVYLDKDLWLLVHPETVSIGHRRVMVKGSFTVQLVLEMFASPELVWGDKPDLKPLPMPPLTRFLREPATFEAITNVHMDYGEVNQYLDDPRMKIKNTVLPGTGNQKLVIESIRLYGSGGKVIVEVKINYNPMIINFSGKPAQMTIYLRGTPRYLADENVFDLPDLEYDVQSSDLLVRIASWLFNSDFKNQLRRIIKFPAGAKMDILKVKINKALNRNFSPSLRLITHVISFRILDGYADNEGIEMRISLKGTSILSVDWN